jgi:hypothetical protein
MTILYIFNYYFTCINILLIILSVFLINYFILNTRYRKKTQRYIFDSSADSFTNNNLHELDRFYKDIFIRLYKNINNPIKLDYQINQIKKIKITKFIFDNHLKLLLSHKNLESTIIYKKIYYKLKILKINNINLIIKKLIHIII